MLLLIYHKHRFMPVFCNKHRKEALQNSVNRCLQPARKRKGTPAKFEPACKAALSDCVDPRSAKTADSLSPHSAAYQDPAAMPIIRQDGPVFRVLPQKPSPPKPHPEIENPRLRTKINTGTKMAAAAKEAGKVPSVVPQIVAPKRVEPVSAPAPPRRPASPREKVRGEASLPRRRDQGDERSSHHRKQKIAEKESRHALQLERSIEQARLSQIRKQRMERFTWSKEVLQAIGEDSTRLAAPCVTKEELIERFKGYCTDRKAFEDTYCLLFKVPGIAKLFGQSCVPIEAFWKLMEPHILDLEAKPAPDEPPVIADTNNKPGEHEEETHEMWKCDYGAGWKDPRLVRAFDSLWNGAREGAYTKSKALDGDVL